MAGNIHAQRETQTRNSASVRTDAASSLVQITLEQILLAKPTTGPSERMKQALGISAKISLSATDGFNTNNQQPTGMSIRPFPHTHTLTSTSESVYRACALWLTLCSLCLFRLYARDFLARIIVSFVDFG
jgi:hypothetical protein